MVSEMRRALRYPRLGSTLVVLVATAKPESSLVASLGSAVKPLVHFPESVQSTRIGGIGVVDDAILEHERAHARSLARVQWPRRFRSWPRFPRQALGSCAIATFERSSLRAAQLLAPLDGSYTQYLRRAVAPR